MVEPWGLAGDRRWLVVDGGGRFVSQREEPALARVIAACPAAGTGQAAGGMAGQPGIIFSFPVSMARFSDRLLGA